MTLEEFRGKASFCTEHEEVDILCIKWLQYLAKDHGGEGKVALMMLDNIRELLEI